MHLVYLFFYFYSYFYSIILRRKSMTSQAEGINICIRSKEDSLLLSPLYL